MRATWIRFAVLTSILLFPSSPPVVHAQAGETARPFRSPGDPWADAPILKADVIIAGGSTAALAAAFAAAEEGAQTILIEPTNWVGGQLTSSGVPAVDEAWHRITNVDGEILLDVAKIARDSRNTTQSLRSILDSIGNPGRGWVSRYCFEPKQLLDEFLIPWEKRLSDRLTIYRDTVLKQVHRNRDTLLEIDVIRRMPKESCRFGGYDRLPSADLKDWYSPRPSDRFHKSLYRIQANPNGVFMDATEWGEMLALANVEYLQGVDVAGKPVARGDRFGQATVYSFVQRMGTADVADADRPDIIKVPNPHVDAVGWGKYQDREDAWAKVWTYRRLRSTQPQPSEGDLCLQNWGFSAKQGAGGNDYPFGYLFLSKAETVASLKDWCGGVDLATMAAAEQRAYAWHHWFRSQTPKALDAKSIVLVNSVLDTGHGLSKLPYVRDTRRSIGIDRFLLTIDDLVGMPSDRTGNPFADTIAIGAYPADVHPLVGFDYPASIREHIDTRPFCIPFRALTHRELSNFLVAGKTMAQGFMANSATRVHPIEWSTGTAAGTLAAMMAREGYSASQILERIGDAQRRVTRRTPILWNPDHWSDPD